MLGRQTTWVEEDDEDDDEDEEDDVAPSSAEPKNSSSATAVETDQSNQQKMIAGFCGRCGKMADTCYCFWNAGALAVSVWVAVVSPATDRSG